MTARIAVVSVTFGVLQLGLAFTGVSSLPLPTGLNVTLLALPATLAGVLGGPIAGAIVGAIFGTTSVVLATTPLFQNPVIAILPRVLVGPAAAAGLQVTKRRGLPLALAAAGALGAATNTGLVLVLATLITSPIGAPYLPPDAAFDIARTNLPAEVVVAGVVTIAVGLAARALGAMRA